MISINRILALFRKDYQATYATMIPFVVAMIFLGITGYFFYSFVLVYAQISMEIGSDPNLAKGINPMDSVLRPIYMNLSIVLLLTLPIITMRSVSEERKHKTIELLFTYPITNLELILGKYLALIFVYVTLLLPTCLLPLFLFLIGAEIAWLELLIAYLGIFLFGSSCLALGLFTSSISENQTVSAILAFGLLLFFWMISWAAEVVQNKTLSRIFEEIALIKHYRGFASGMLQTNDLIYFALFILFFLYLTYKVFEKREWR